MLHLDKVRPAAALPRVLRSRPPYRRLRAFAFDPILSARPDTAPINQVVLKVPWEDLEPGPVGEYLEVVDVDPPSRACYPPVDLNDPYVLADDGLAPSEGDPQFHQQMVYAVAMTTIRNFEHALGRRALWAPRRDGRTETFVRRLRIYPHALLEANAYYSPAKKALLFGYFPASMTTPGRNLPGGMVFSCLSHDIIAHEVTHALLDGLHRRFIEPSNPDVLAFHEAFADLVALFQHFSFPEVLRHQIAKTRGDLSSRNLLAELAQQFGQGIGTHGALRDALGGHDPRTGEWKPREPDPAEIHRTHEPHARGAILVAAVFEAFLTIYQARTDDLFRIATGGTGVLPAGAIHPDLVNRLAEEAAKSARHLLRMCIRALDYCPPVDITFGEYLRAVVTADRDLVPEDSLGYRRAVIEAFRRRGIYPSEVRSLSEESLLWRPPTAQERVLFDTVVRDMEDLRNAVLRDTEWMDQADIESGLMLGTSLEGWGLESDREVVFHQSRQRNAFFHKRFAEALYPRAPGPGVRPRPFGLALHPDAPKSIFRRNRDGLPTVEVHSVRPARRLGPGSEVLTDIVVVLTQRRRGYLDSEKQLLVDQGNAPDDMLERPDFIYRGGCTLLISLETGELRYVISKAIQGRHRLEMQRAFLSKPPNPSLAVTYFGDPRLNYFEEMDQSELAEPFVPLHRAPEPERVE